jgi:hypothetical protein
MAARFPPVVDGLDAPALVEAAALAGAGPLEL